MAVSVVLTDIEGTTTPVSFVHAVLFPFARERLAAFAAAHPDLPALAETRAAAPNRAPVDTLLKWMDEDAKIAPLKEIQGLIWADGYRSGVLKSQLYPDVAPALRALRANGVRLAVYSSGSEAAQRLVFGHAPDGDLTRFFDGFFDTRIGSKRDAASYAAIASRLCAAPGQVAFFSDSEAELDAAAAAGMKTCQILRPEDGTAPSARHALAGDFWAAAQHFGLIALYGNDRE